MRKPMLYFTEENHDLLYVFVFVFVSVSLLDYFFILCYPCF